MLLAPAVTELLLSWKKYFSFGSMSVLRLAKVMALLGKWSQINIKKASRTAMSCTCMIVPALAQSPLIFRKTQTKEKAILLRDFYAQFAVYLCITQRETEREQRCILGKSRAGKNPLLSGFPISVVVIQKEEQTPHLDTGHIERIYLGVSRSVCSLSCMRLLRFQHRQDEECID